jgi:hypothetical protein
VAIVQPMDRTIGQSKEWNAADKTGVEAMTIKVERGNCRHQCPILLWQDYFANFTGIGSFQNRL